MGIPLIKIVILKRLSLIAIIIMAIFVRVDDLQNQFPTIDDTGVAWTLLNHTDQLNVSYIKKKIYDSKHEDFNTPQYILLRSLDEAQSLELGLAILKPVIKMTIIPQTWTYAPIQYIFTSILLNNNLSYKSVLFWGRFPSCVFSILSLLMLVLLLRKIFKDEWYLPTIFSLLIFGFSLENIVYAKHMSNYSAGMFSLLLLINIYIASRNSENLKSPLLQGFLLAICVGLSYQVLFFIPAFFGSWLLMERKTFFKKNEFIIRNLNNIKFRNFIRIFFAFLVFSSALIFTFVIFQSKRGEAGSTGIPNRYYFEIPFMNTLGVISTFLNDLSYTITFFISNGFETTNFLLSNSQYTSSVSLFIIYSFIFVMLVGLFSGIKSQNKGLKEISVFIILSIVTYFLLILFKKIPLSPSRHSLILLPILAIMIAMGIFAIFRLIPNSRRIYFLIITLFAGSIMVGSFWSNYNDFISKRVDLMNDSRLNYFIKKSKPEFIVMPKYFVMNKLLNQDWVLESYNSQEIYSSYRTSVKGRFNSGVILAIHQSDLFFDYKYSNVSRDDIKSKSKKKSGYFIAGQYYYQTGGSLGINGDVKESKNQILFRIYFPINTK
jgi:hypothetical protein